MQLYVRPPQFLYHCVGLFKTNKYEGIVFTFESWRFATEKRRAMTNKIEFNIKYGTQTQCE